MSKVSFRARALDVSKPLPIYKAGDVPEMPDFDKINRGVVQMPTGMEKEEEMETHLQKALTAQQCYGSAEKRTIPIPDVQSVDLDRYERLYASDFKLSKQYIHVEALGMEHEIPDYDLDSEDENWLQEQSKKMEITSLKFEEMMDRLEKGSGQQVVTLSEAKLLVKEDDDLIITVYDYWLNKRLRLEMPLIPQVKSEKRDGTTTNNPYVAFRRRSEKMQTRKNRKNDEVSYEKMLKLKRDMVKALTLTQFLKRREKSKKEMLQLTLEVMEKRYQMEDFNGTMLAEAEAERAKMPSFIPPFLFNNQGHGAAGFTGEELAPVRKKRPYRRRQKQQQQARHPNAVAAALATAASFGEVDILHHDMDSSEEDFLSPAASPSDHEDENDPDGPFAFKRRKTCSYYAPICDRLGNWPWSHPKEGGKGDSRHRFSLTTLRGGRCVGYARRRVGRGGRVILDRGFTPWDDTLEKQNFSPGQSYSGQVGDYLTFIRESKIPYYRPQSPPPDEDSSQDKTDPPCHPSAFSSRPPSSSSQEFNLESFNCHREQLLARHMEQEAHLLNQDSVSPTPLDSLGGGSNSAPGQSSAHTTSRLTLDSASAQFAVTAVIDSTQLETGGSKGARVDVSGNQSHTAVVGDTDQQSDVAVISDAAVTIPSSSLVSSLSSITSSVSSSPIVFSSLPAIMATRSVAVCAAPSTVQSHKTLLVTPTFTSSSRPQAAGPLHAAQLSRQKVSNGPVATSSPAAASLIHGRVTGPSTAATVLRLSHPITTATVLRAVVPAPTPTPVVTASATPTITVHGPTAPVSVAPAPDVDKTNNKITTAATASSNKCNMSSTSIKMLKYDMEDCL